jgi:NAD(P)-dependent dehydrogenase (short-subunit alcohol dehydrogenase family)
MAGKLEGRRVVVTGASRGVGYETAKRFLREGARILGVGKDSARLSRAAAGLSAGGDFAAVQADLCDSSAPGRVAAAVEERWGAVDILFSNAAILVSAAGAASFEDEPPGTLERTLDHNLVAPFRLTAALLPLLRRGHEPRIVYVGSGAGTLDGIQMPGIASYRLSKWGLHGLTRMQAVQLKGAIAVNAFDPGWVKTDLGGPNAPGSPVDSAEGALACVTLPFETTGKFWKDGEEISF